VCVGTSQGLVLVFDSAQALRWCLNEGAGAEAGAVSALGLSSCGARLLVGHARGAVFMFDLGSGKLLRTLSEAHPPATAVLHLKVREKQLKIFFIIHLYLKCCFVVTLTR
jgi:vacuolar protein sorting-associated protein 8